MKKLFFGELIGTFVLVFFGCGVVAVAVLGLAKVSFWQVATVWGLAVTLGIYISRSLSGAHLNPAITLMLAVTTRLISLKQVLVYISAQLTGATIAGTTVYFLFRAAIQKFEIALNIKRGAPGSELSAMIFGEYFPNPSLTGQLQKLLASITFWEALLAELIGTAILATVVLCLSRTKFLFKLQPLLIGLTLATIITFVAPYTQAGLNPARDLGPRLVSYFAGWRTVAIPGPQIGFLVYILGPILGALLVVATAQLIAFLKLKTPGKHLLKNIRPTSST